MRGAAEKLYEIGGVPARLGNQIKTLFDRDMTLTKEGAGVQSTVARHLAWVDSDLVERAISTSTFDPHELRRNRASAYIRIPPELLEAERGLLRCWLTTLVTAVNRGSESQGEVLFLLDECGALGGNLPVLQEALVRGRSGGIRLLMIFQSDSQVTAAFRDKPSLIFDSSSVQVYFGVNGIETAERINKMLGDQTIMLESASMSRSYQHGGGHDSGGSQASHSRNWQETGRNLMRPEEILTMSSELLIAFVKDVPPILARRIKWFADPLFGTAKEWKQMRRLGWVLLAFGIWLCIAMLRSRQP